MSRSRLARDPGSVSPDEGVGAARADVDSTTDGDEAQADRGRPTRDERKPYRIVVDVLATEEQVDRLHELLGEVLCDAPSDHDGPCRIAWIMSGTGEPEEPDEVMYGFDVEDVALTREVLSPIEVWDQDDVDRSLGL